MMRGRIVCQLCERGKQQQRNILDRSLKEFQGGFFFIYNFDVILFATFTILAKYSRHTCSILELKAADVNFNPAFGGGGGGSVRQSGSIQYREYLFTP